MVHRFRRRLEQGDALQAKKETDVAKYPKAFHRVGLLAAESPGLAELPLIQSSNFRKVQLGI
jgi:hypothetical protein